MAVCYEKENSCCKVRYDNLSEIVIELDFQMLQIVQISNTIIP